MFGLGKKSNIAKISEKINNLQCELNGYKEENKQMMKMLADAISDPYIGRLRLMLHNAGVPKHHEHIFYKARPGSICIDCGTNIGLVTDIFNHLGCLIYAFEPHADLYKFLQYKYKDKKNVTLYQKAILDQNGLIPFQTSTYEHVNYLGCSQGATVEKITFYGDKAFESLYDVETVDLCEFIENTIVKDNLRVYILKIDIEGSEFQVLEKLIAKELYQHIDYIFCETHEQLVDNGMEKMNRLKNLISQKNIKNIYFDWI